MIRRRHVFFIAGFDPKGPGHYHGMYAKQSALQARVSGLNLAVGPRRNDDRTASWTVRADDRGGTVETTVEMLRWDDLVRGSWERRPWKVFAQAVATTWSRWRSGSMQAMHRLSPPVVYAATCPVWAAGLAWLAAALLGAALAAAVLALRAPSWLATVLGVGVVVGLSLATVLLIHRIQIGWFLRLVRFVSRKSAGETPEAESRIDAFAARIASIGDDLDEVLVVGHSVGGNLAVSALARAMTLRPTLTHGGPRLSLLTLGHCIPLESTLPTAAVFRRELLAVAASDIDWLDVSAPLDWATFPLTDPLAGLRPRPAESDWHPYIVSPRFHLLFSEAGYARLKARRFLVHLQYLMAAELPGLYDYFAITAGSQTLRERFASS